MQMTVELPDDRRLLGLELRFEVHALLKEHRVPLQYTASDLEDDMRAHRK